MSLIRSKQKPTYNWQKGDLITARDAAELCGYRSAKQFQDEDRRRSLGFDFTVVWQGARMFFLRSEVDEYLSSIVSAAQTQKQQRNKDLRVAA